MLSLIIPVYMNEGSISALISAVDSLDNRLEGKLEVIFVVDGSPDNSWKLLNDALPSRRFRSQLILLSRNFGSFTAIRTGLQYGSGNRFAIMAADLQEPPDLVLEMNEKLENEDLDIVVGVREFREDPGLSKLSSNTFWWIYRKFVMPEIPPGGVDMFACTRQARDVLLMLEERHSSLISQLFWIGFRRGLVTYCRNRREHGKSAWTFKKKINYLMDSVFSFTDLPIRVLVRLGFVGTVMASLYGVFILSCKLLGVISPPGYSTTIFLICFFASLNMLGVGIVGSYAWRIYENTKNRPLSIPMRHECFSGNDDD